MTVSSQATYALGADDEAGSIAGGGDIALSTMSSRSVELTSTTFSGVISGRRIVENWNRDVNPLWKNAYTGPTTINGGLQVDVDVIERLHTRHCLR